MLEPLSVAVVGCGPYGLSVAAHLRAQGITFQVFGRPMRSWRESMPRGMRLKSEGFASCLSDPSGRMTLAAFCAEQGLDYADRGRPVPVEVFAAYGEAFQKTLLPDADPRNVARIVATAGGFALTLENGESVEARQVVVAVGIGAYGHVPSELSAVSPARLSHTASRSDYDVFAGRRVLVVGSGASAVDAAAALVRGGAAVELVTRSAAIRFHEGGVARWTDRLFAPETPLGPGWRKWLCVKGPGLFRLLPARLRVSLVTRYLGPAPTVSAKSDFEGRVRVHASRTLIGAMETQAGVAVEIADGHGRRETILADHVVAGTGYRVDLSKLDFLEADLCRSIRHKAGVPVLSAGFETSVPGLFLVGTPAAFTFGPLLRFVCGARYAAMKVTQRIGARERSSREKGVLPSGGPRILFVSLVGDVGADRIVAAMDSRGAACGMVAPAASFPIRSRFVRFRCALPRQGGQWLGAIRLRRTLGHAIRRWQPDLIVPLDELAASRLRDPMLLRGFSPAARALIERSLGPLRHAAILRSREALVGTAASLGIPTPRQSAVRDMAGARAAAAALGYPLAVKREETCGGFGVAIVRDEAELVAAVKAMRRTALAKTIAQRALLLTPNRRTIILQSFVPGPMAFYIVACADGEVLDGVGFVAAEIDPPVTGASTIIRPVERPDMAEAARRMVSALGCSGFLSFDFILGPDGACLIEVNPRPVVSGHLGALYGHDLYGAWLARFGGGARAQVSMPMPMPAPAAVALFPRELARDPNSRWLQDPAAVFHDVPTDDPHLIACYADWLASREPRDGDVVARIIARWLLQSRRARNTVTAGG